MNLESFLQHLLTFTGSFNARLLAIVFSACFIGEVAVAVPYLMETVWLSSGYHTATGALSPQLVLLLFFSSQSGRQLGTIALARLSQLSSLPVIKLYRKFYKAKLPEIPENRQTRRLNIDKKYLSPFSVAIGRLMWLRIPLTIGLGVTGHWGPLSLGVLISSAVWDAVYFALGMLGGNAVLKPVQMAAYSLIGITAMYILTFISRRLYKLFRPDPVRQ
jgi:membrane-associated protein